MTKKAKSGTITVEDVSAVGPPTLLDGSPVEPSEAQRVHEGLLDGSIKVELAPGVKLPPGVTLEDMRKMMIESMKKTMS